MAPELTVRLVTAEQRPVLERLWQLYRHDLSELRGSLPDRDGLFHTRPLRPFLDDPDLRAYLFERGGGPSASAWSDA
jgi:hypothetical protein